MNNWVKMTNDEMEVGIEIATLKKGELQIKYAKDIVARDKEIERLNNILNEFEEWLNNIPNYFMDRRSNNTGVYVQKGMQQMIDMCNNKLQELEGRDKE